MLDLLLGRRRKARNTSAADAEGHSFTISPDTRVSVQDTGVVFFHVKSGKVFRSNRVGAAIWRKIESQKALDEIASEVAQEYGIAVEEAHQDAESFLTQLVARGFLATTRRRHAA